MPRKQSLGSKILFCPTTVIPSQVAHVGENAVQDVLSNQKLLEKENIAESNWTHEIWRNKITGGSDNYSVV